MTVSFMALELVIDFIAAEGAFTVAALLYLMQRIAIFPLARLLLLLDKHHNSIIYFIEASAWGSLDTMRVPDASSSEVVFFIIVLQAIELQG